MTTPKYSLLNTPGLTAGLETAGMKHVAVWKNVVWDGELRAVVHLAPTGWTMSLSHGSVDRKGKVKKRRYPTWVEIAEAKDELLEGGLAYICSVPSGDEAKEMADTTIDVYQFPPLDPDAPVPTEERRASGLIVPV